MKETAIPGVFQNKNKIFTENPDSCKGLKVYNEKIIKYKGWELRSWNPYRSKLAAAILNGFKLKIKDDSKILYLGAATGTTVSHLSDISGKGIIYAVENSPIAVKKLINVCEKRTNIIPIFEDANHPDRFSSIVANVDLVYQDISQRNQAGIFSSNINRYLKIGGYGILMVKARSIDVSLKPKKAYDIVCSELEKDGLRIEEQVDLNPYVKDHMAIIISNLI
jgi:fibrillarin-like pre-rRNA processing protein